MFCIAIYLLLVYLLETSSHYAKFSYPVILYHSYLCKINKILAHALLNTVHELAYYILQLY